MKNLAAKLIKVQRAIKPVEKDGHNDFHDYDYTTESGFLNMLRPILVENNLIVLANITESTIVATLKDKNGKDIPLTRVHIIFSIIDVDSGESFTGGAEGQGADALDKGVYKAITGATKYFLAKCFQIPTGDDPENERHTQEPQTPWKAPTTETLKAAMGTLGNCDKCGAANKWSEKKKKPYCGKLCWKNTDANLPVIQQEEAPPLPDEPPF